jgi:carbon starvation protein
MSLTLLAIGVLVLLSVGYLWYGRFIAAQYRLNDANTTPAAKINDGVEFIPTRPFYLMAQHFSAIAAAGPIVGPVLACIAFGWGPCLLWIVFGVILIGAVHDFSALLASVRHGAHSIADVAREHLGKRAYLALVAFIWLALLYVIVAFTDVTAGTFIGESEELQGLSGVVSFNVGGAVAGASIMYLLLACVMGVVQQYLKPPMWLVTLIFVPLTLAAIWAGTQISNWQCLSAPHETLNDILKHVFSNKAPELGKSARPAIWGTLILVYCFIASMLPLWVLQQPRGYLGGFVLYLAIGVGVLGILFGNFDIQQPAFKTAAEYGNAYSGFFSLGPTGPGGTGAPPVSVLMTSLIFPFLFVTIACGACSGFHGLVCGGTTARQLSKESHCTPVAFGAMLLEGFVAVVALATVMILSKEDLAKYAGRPGAVYGDGLAIFVTKVFHLESSSARSFARTFGQMAVATFVFDTLDVSTRLGRYLLQELVGVKNRATALIAAGATAGIPLIILLTAQKGSYLLFWTLFGTSNQLLASLTLLAVTVWLKRTGRKCWYVFWPMVFVMSTTVVALSLQVFTGARDAFAGRMFSAPGAAAGAGGFNPTVLNAGVALVLLALAALFVFEATWRLRRMT